MGLLPSDELDAVGRGYLEHLTEGDLAVLAGGADPAALITAPAEVVGRFDDPAVFAAVFEPDPDGPERFRYVSPFFAFASAVHRTTADLRTAAYIPEWTAPRQRLPVFEGAQLSAFLAGPRRRLFLIELLASYAHVTSGSYWTRTARGWRRQRWSELDPVRLAGLLDVVPQAERPGIHRRLGDLALFLSGVFPDHSAQHVFGQVDAARLLRSAGARPRRDAAYASLELLELLGTRWYRLAVSGAAARSAQLLTVDAVADAFGDARRILNVVADRYLFALDPPWFPRPWS